VTDIVTLITLDGSGYQAAAPRVDANRSIRETQRQIVSAMTCTFPR
jgi:hypothetical protein